jgi:hypothetical protein
MHSLNLLELAKPEFVQLPASRHPDWADVYFCDNCGANVTEYLRRLNGHSWPPYGPEFYRCSCGREYRTGAVEWDSLEPAEHRGRIVDLLGLGIVISIVGMLFGVPIGIGVYLVSHAAKTASLAGLIVSLTLGFALSALEAIAILRSMVRTRLVTLFNLGK